MRTVTKVGLWTCLMAGAVSTFADGYPSSKAPSVQDLMNAHDHVNSATHNPDNYSEPSQKAHVKRSKDLIKKYDPKGKFNRRGNSRSLTGLFVELFDSQQAVLKTFVSS